MRVLPDVNFKENYKKHYAENYEKLNAKREERAERRRSKPRGSLEAIKYRCYSDIHKSRQFFCHRCSGFIKICCKRAADCRD